MLKPVQIEGASFPIRHPQIDFNHGLDQYYLKNNAIISHCFGGLNLLFPAGEQFFVESVARYSGQIRDPNLLADVKIFCGQETQHKNQHKLFIQQLEKRGYKLDHCMRRIQWYIDHVGGFLPDVIKLSTTVACEHWTATMAHSAFKNKILDEGSLPVRQLIIWHAIEEMEHKNVAFDVLNTLYPNKYFYRLLGFIVSCVTIYLFILLGLISFLSQDFKNKRLNLKIFKDHLKSLVKDRGILRFLKDLNINYFKFLSPRFRPSLVDDSQLIKIYLPTVRQFFQ